MHKVVTGLLLYNATSWLAEKIENEYFDAFCHSYVGADCFILAYVHRVKFVVFYYFAFLVLYLFCICSFPLILLHGLGEHASMSCASSLELNVLLL